MAQGFLQSGPCPNPSDRFHVGRVAVYRRGATWYLDYHEHGQRRRPRAGRDRATARRQAAQINAQLENSAPTALNFEPIALTALQARWLDYLEHVRRASLATLRRYRAASNYLLRYCAAERGGGRGGVFASQITARDAEAFAAHLRRTPVSPNGHPQARLRPLRDGGVRYILAVRVEFMRLTAAIGHSEIAAPKTLRHGFATALQDANVDPLIRNQLMGHAPSSGGVIVAGLGMTSLYTHTRTETLRDQLGAALARRLAIAFARAWLEQRALAAGA